MVLQGALLNTDDLAVHHSYLPPLLLIPQRLGSHLHLRPERPLCRRVHPRVVHRGHEHGQEEGDDGGVSDEPDAAVEGDGAGGEVDEVGVRGEDEEQGGEGQEEGGDPGQHLGEESLSEENDNVFECFYSFIGYL